MNKVLISFKNLFWPTESFQKEVFFVLAAGITVYVYATLLSFNPNDTSVFTSSYPPVAKTSNLGGFVGAQVSAVLTYLFGLGAFFIPLPLLLSTAFRLRAKYQMNSLSNLLAWVGLFFCVLIVAERLSLPFSFRKIEFAPGGRIGNQLEVFLKIAVGDFGVNTILGIVGFSSLLFLTRRSIGELLGQCFKILILSFKRKGKEDGERPAKIISNSPVFHLASAPTSEQVRSRDVEIFERDEDILYEPSLGIGSRTEKAENYEPPPASIFKTSDSNGPLSETQKQEYESTAKQLTESFADFGILGGVIAIQPGPVVTVYEFKPDAGTKISKMVGLIDDIALSLKVDSIFIHPVKGKSAVGVQVPNTQREVVRLGDIINAESFKNSESPLTIALGKSISGQPVCADLTKMPHLLMAGATGSGKSVAINSLLCSFIMKASPREVRMILVDPKMLELSMYEGIPHLLTPVITEPGRASLVLKWAIQEMERRYRLMQVAKVRNIIGFNEFWNGSSPNKKEELKTAFRDGELSELPYILLVIDELADLMMMAAKDVEASIQRLAQKARASGIHLVLATQRPSVDIITGVIKANLPCRAAFQVVSKHDSRTILDRIGADKLLGHGDFLFQKPGANHLERIQGAFISDQEVIHLVEEVKRSACVQYDEGLIDWIDEEAERQKESGRGSFDLEGDEDDPKFDLAVQIAMGNGAVSASYLQRQLKIGYNRAARIVENMERQGLVAPADGVKPRKWLGQSGTLGS